MIILQPLSASRFQFSTLIFQTGMREEKNLILSINTKPLLTHGKNESGNIERYETNTFTKDQLYFS